MIALLKTLGASAPHLPYHPLRFRGILFWSVLAALAFHTAYLLPGGAALMLLFLLGLVRLARVRTSRQAMNIGWVLGLAVYSPHLAFFWTVFGPGAISLWLVLAFWLAVFLVTLRKCQVHFGPLVAAVLAPVLWLGFEFFRSELYYLRFTWLNAGYAFSDSPGLISIFGMYGIGFLLMAVAAAIDRLNPRRLAATSAGCVILVIIAGKAGQSRSAFRASPSGGIQVAGVQIEFPGVNEVLVAIEKLQRQRPETDLFVLGEYTFDGPVAEKVREWCQRHSKHLIAGGKDYIDASQFRNTAWVIGPSGQVVFQQAKAVPIQFFKDGLPAATQQVWDSPWGRVGVATCYDLSYTRVVDQLVHLGAQAIINPTMDIEDWGEYEHRLHSRIPLVRAAEYGIPILRVATSGISQLIDVNGRLVATAGFARNDAQISGTLDLVPHGRVPWDRMLGRICVAITALLAALFGTGRIIAWAKSRRSAPPRHPVAPGNHWQSARTGPE